MAFDARKAVAEGRWLLLDVVTFALISLASFASVIAIVGRLSGRGGPVTTD